MTTYRDVIIDDKKVEVDPSLTIISSKLLCVWLKTLLIDSSKVPSSRLTPSITETKESDSFTLHPPD